MFECPQCGDTFQYEEEMIAHLEVDDKVKISYGVKKVKRSRCPEWPVDQIQYFLEKGLLGQADPTPKPEEIGGI